MLRFVKCQVSYSAEEERVSFSLYARVSQHSSEELIAVLNALCDHFQCEGYIDACLRHDSRPRDSLFFQYTKRAGLMKRPYAYAFDLKNNFHEFTKRQLEDFGSLYDDFLAPIRPVLYGDFEDMHFNMYMHRTHRVYVRFYVTGKRFMMEKVSEMLSNDNCDLWTSSASLYKSEASVLKRYDSRDYLDYEPVRGRCRVYYKEGVLVVNCDGSVVDEYLEGLTADEAEHFCSAIRTVFPGLKVCYTYVAHQPSRLYYRETNRHDFLICGRPICIKGGDDVDEHFPLRYVYVTPGGAYASRGYKEFIKDVRKLTRIDGGNDSYNHSEELLEHYSYDEFGLQGVLYCAEVQHKVDLARYNALIRAYSNDDVFYLKD